MSLKPPREVDGRRVQWLFPAAVTLHNLEEAIWLPEWVAKHSGELPFVISPGAFRFAAAVLTVAAYVITYLSVRRGRESIWAYVLFGYAAAVLVNVFVPHVPAALIFRSYVPGLATAVVLNLPVMSFILMNAIKQGCVSGRKAVAFGIGVPVGISGIIPVLFAVGKVVAERR
jgi:hypothetical protein